MAKFNSSDVKILGEFLRQYTCFHEDENMKNVSSWALFSWSDIFEMRNADKILHFPTSDGKTCWCVPNTALIDQVISPGYQDYLKDRNQPKDKFAFDVYDRYILPYIYKDGRLKNFKMNP